jgi:hypothetical protein
MYVDLVFPPGVFANGTARQARGRWRDSNLVRSPDGPDLQPIGGWVQRGTSAVTGAARALVTWKDNSNVRWVGVGTHSKLYVQSSTGALSDITPTGFTAGRADATTGGGYGDGPYGVDAFGTPRTDTEQINPASVWTLDAWGQHLVGCMAEDGKLYEWTLNTATPAAQIANAPTNCSGLSVSAERFLFAYAGRNIAWCDQENDTVWTPSATNQAGDQDIDTFGAFRFGKKVPGAHLHFTDVDVWRSTYQGLPSVHGFEKVGDDCGPVSVGAAVTIDSRCVWMGQQSFFLYNGYTQAMSSEVADRVFSDFNTTQASKVTSWHNGRHGEVWWFYPSASSTENDRYVFWNYRLDHWWLGALGRTCGTGSGVFRYPILVDASGVIYEHEQGFAYAGAVPYARSGPIEWPGDMAQGDQRMLVRGFVADEKTQGDAQVSFFAREFPNSAEATLGPYAIASAPVDLLFSARQVELEVAFTGMDDARAGVFRLDAEPVSAR